VIRNDYCNYQKKNVNPDYRMCRKGFLFRLNKGIEKAAYFFKLNPDDKRIDEVLKKLARFQELYLKMELDGEFDEKKAS